MKFIISLLGLALFGAGLYLIQWTYPQFDALELQNFALYLALSFFASSLGLFVFFLPFTMSRKKQALVDSHPSPDLNEAFLSMETENTVLFNETPVNDSLDESSPQEALTQTQEEIDFPIIGLETASSGLPLDLETPDNDSKPEELSLEDNIQDDQELTRVILKEDLKQETITDPAEVFNHTNYDPIIVKLMDIKTWGHQKIIKKLFEGDILSIEMKKRHGLNLPIMKFKNKEIGYIAKVEYIKVQDRIEDLAFIDVAELVYEGSKVSHVKIRFNFKKNTV